MKTMTKGQLAVLLDGNESVEVMTLEQERIAAENNLLVLFCQSDDTLEMRGAIHGEEDAAGGGDFALILEGEQFSDDDSDAIQRAGANAVMRISDEYDNEDNPRLIRVEWCRKDGTSWAWDITSNLPRVWFTIWDNGEPYTGALVIDLDEVEPLKQH